ncbi:TPA: peptidase S41 [Candidatus Gastranaerophilales bacterium HUM_9]|nr:MAG TPA: peptidase S41 [Candidatus Gastranaerophilales bacterium HUM_9]HBX34201.1 peptidase S41 [Cyanobacteria bacterium UBA11440]
MYIDYKLSLMLNETMKRKELVILILTVILVILLYKCITNAIYTSLPLTMGDDSINTKQISSQKLFEKSWSVINQKYIDSSLNSQNWSYWKKHYKNKIKTDEDAKVAIDTMIASLNDPYSRFLSKQEFEEQFRSIDAHITGIGINIINNSGKTVIHSVIDGTPAQKSGLKSNDIITEVNGKNINGMDLSSVATLIRGPIDSKVKLKIKRGNSYLIKYIKREEIEIKSVESRIDKNNIGYIKIKSFIGSNTASDFVKALKDTSKTDGLIIDLRGNTGGLLSNAVVVANLFINNGKIVSIVSRNGKKNDISAKTDFPIITKPTVVLVDETSASASEILSGALKDNHKAILVGSKTYGKGLVQQIIPLENSTGLNITIAKYLTPNGSDINKKGIEPDINVPYSISERRKHNDIQLKKAEMIVYNMCKK